MNVKALKHPFNGIKRLDLMLLGLVCILWLIAFSGGLRAAASVWWVSEIFHHGAFVLPISIWLIYRKRHELFAVEFSTNYWVLPFVILLLFLNVLGVAGKIELFQYVATFGIIPFSAWFLLGSKSVKIILFPLFFIFFAIPVGDEIIPLLQELTADLSVFFLKLVNAPVFREGLYIEIPNGRFHVAEACSGISFLIVSIVFGSLYSYLSFTHYKKKILFVFLSFFVPIIANALRVMGIVIIGHVWGMEYAGGTDHLIYGWVFYCFVLFLLLFIGERIRDHESNQNSKNDHSEKHLKLKFNTAYGVLIGVFIIIISWQLWLSNLTSELLPKDRITNLNDIIKIKKISLNPIFTGHSEAISGEIIQDNKIKIEVFVAWFHSDAIGDMTSSKQSLFDKKRWHIIQTKLVQIKGPVFNGELKQLTLKTNYGQQKHFKLGYIHGNTIYSKRWQVSLASAFSKMIGQQESMAVILFESKTVDEFQLLEALLNNG